MQLQEPSNGQRNAKAAGPNIRSRSQNYAVDCITFAAISMFGAWINPLASILPFILTSWCRLVYLLMTNPGNWENRITSRHRLERLCNCWIDTHTSSIAGPGFSLETVIPEHVQTTPLTGDLQCFGRVLILTTPFGQHTQAMYCLRATYYPGS